MNKSSWLIYVYIAVGIIIISSLLYSFNFSLKDIKTVGTETPTQLSTTTTDTVSDTGSSAGESSEPQTYTVELGKGTTIKGVSYVFSRVSSDTRCVDKEKCQEPGKAEIDLLIGGAGTMETVKMSTEAPSTYENQSISIKSLTPIPVSNKEKIMLTFEVTNTK